MSTISVNGARVATATITIPMYGAWTADVDMSDGNAITPLVTLVVGDLTLIGTVVRQASFAGDTSARIVGGAGGWRTSLPAKGYAHDAGVKLSTVLADVARECGERIVIATDRVLGTRYARDESKARDTLDALVGGQWWIDNATGITRTDARASTAITTPFNVITRSCARGEFEIATEFLSSWVPGRTFSANTVPTTQTISSVTIKSDNDGKLRLHVLSTDALSLNRLIDAVRAIVRAETASVLYAGVWEYRVVSGTTTTVDAVAVDRRMPDIKSCPMMPGLLGEVVTPTPGSLCRVVFVNGDPARYECIGIVGPPVLSKLSGGLLGSARQTDTVQAGPWGGTITGGSTKVLVG